MSNNNNPFENGSNSSPFEAGQTKQQKAPQMKRPNKNNNQNYNNAFNSKKKRKPIVILVILAILAIILAANWWRVRMFFYDLETKNELNSVEVVEDYTFDPKDIHDEGYQPILELEIGQGKDYSIDDTSENFFVKSDGEGGSEGAFIVGRDIEPGIYTMTVSGDAYMNMDTALNVYFDIPYEGEKVYYNVPLVKGDKIDVITYNDESEVSVDLKTQSEYVEYVSDEEMLGVYVYGLSNFNPEVTLNKDDYDSVLYAYPDPDLDEYIHSEYIYRKDITLNGGKSTYFVIQ